MKKVLLFLFLISSFYCLSQQKKDSIDEITEKQIQQIEIIAKRKLVERKGDKIVFNVSNSIFSTGLNANEILKNVPRIDPTSESLKIIGKSNVLVMVNDKLLNLSGSDMDIYLKSIRAENILKIELITTPPSNYDASGNSGLINIILKNNINLGFDGSLTGTFIQRKKAGFMPSANLAYSNNKVVLGLNLFADNEIRNAESNIDIKYPDLLRKSNIYREDKTKGLTIGFNIDYKINDKSNAGIVINTDWWNTNQNSESKVFFIKNNIIDSSQDLPSINKNKYDYISISPYYDIKLDTLGKKIKFNYNLLKRNNDNFRNLISRSYIGNYDILGNEMFAINNSESIYRVNTFNVDFELPFKRFRIDIGGKYSNFTNDSDIKYYDYITGGYVLDENQSNIFKYKESIYSIYFSAEKKWNNKLFSKIGIRYEGTQTVGNSITTGALFENSFDNFFPSLYFSYEPNDKNSFSIGYNKRIDRPVFYDINPFRTYFDLYNYSEGNPRLQPSITHNIELSYIFKNNLTVTTYGSIFKDVSDYVTISEINNPVIISRPENYFSKKTLGLDISYNWSITKKLSTYNSFSAYFNNTRSNIPNITLSQLNGFGYYFSSRSTYKIGENSKIYLNYYNKFPSTEGLYKIYNRSSITFGGIFNFMEKKLVLNVSISDIFRQASTKMEQDYSNFVWKSNVYNDQRNLNISITYKFGNNKSKSVNREINDSDKNRLVK
ncbi:outer membrane beta-barrel family protein [Bergeyella porcorum]|uniref:outer membrane beta-barrel family protein n=1 Tax=Bergeyella porcorum TaxID=1735111 RepID=UPI002E1B4872